MIQNSVDATGFLRAHNNLNDRLELFMSNSNEPISLDNVIEILEIYVNRLKGESGDDVDMLRNVLVWSLNYLRSYRDAISCIFPHKHL